MTEKKNIIQTTFVILTSIILIAGIVYSQSEGPTALKANASGNGVNLTWTAPSSGTVAFYNIYKASEAGSGNSMTKSDSAGSSTADPDSNSSYSNLDFSKISTASSNSYTDTITGSDAGMFVYYVTAVSSNGTESAPSNYAKVTIEK